LESNWSLNVAKFGMEGLHLKKFSPLQVGGGVAIGSYDRRFASGGAFFFLDAGMQFQFGFNFPFPAFPTFPFGLGGPLFPPDH